MVRRQQAGQVLPFLLMTITLLAFLVGYLIDTARVVHERVQSQTVADVVALSACRIQATSLNSLATLNRGIVEATTLARSIVATWASLAACASLCGFGACACAEPLAIYSRRAPGLLRRLRQSAKAMATAQDRITAAVPKLTLSTTAWLATENRSRLTSLQWRLKKYENSAFSTPPLYLHRRPETIVTGAGKFPGLLELNTNFVATQTLQIEIERQISHSGNALQLTTLAHAQPSRPAAITTALLQSDWEAKLIPVDKQLLSLPYQAVANAVLH